MRRSKAVRVVPWLLLVLGCIVAYGAGRGLGWLVPTFAAGAAAAAESAPAPTFAVRETDAAGLRAGDLVLGEQRVITIAVPAGGLEGYERAMVVADRLNRQLLAGVQAADFETRLVEGMGQFVGQSGSVIFTVTADDAVHAGQTVAELTTQWANAVWAVLPGQPPAPPALGEPTPAAEHQPLATASAEWVPEEPYEDKYVPILSILRGVRVGVARVNGPKSKVDLTQAVGQLELKFKDVLDIEVYIPISTKEPGKTLARVQSVGVTGLGDLKL